MKIGIDDMAGTVILLMVYVALHPVIQKSIQIILPQVGPTESLIVSSLPLVIILVIMMELFDINEEEDENRVSPF